MARLSTGTGAGITRPPGVEQRDLYAAAQKVQGSPSTERAGADYGGTQLFLRSCADHRSDVGQADARLEAAKERAQGLHGQPGAITLMTGAREQPESDSRVGVGNGGTMMHAGRASGVRPATRPSRQARIAQVSLPLTNYQ